MPGSLLSQYAPVNGASEPFRRHTANCSALSSRRHSSSVLFMSFAIKWSSSLIHAMHASRQQTDHRLGGGEARLRVLPRHELAVDHAVDLPIGCGFHLGAEFAQAALQQKWQDAIELHLAFLGIGEGGDDAVLLHETRDELGDLV